MRQSGQVLTPMFYYTFSFCVASTLRQQRRLRRRRGSGGNCPWQLRYADQENGGSAAAGLGMLASCATARVRTRAVRSQDLDARAHEPSEDWTRTHLRTRTHEQSGLGRMSARAEGGLGRASWTIENKECLFVVDEAHILRTEIDAHDAVDEQEKKI